LSQFTTPNGRRQTVRIPLSVFERNVSGGLYDFQRLKDITFVAMRPSGARFVFDNIKMIGACTDAPPPPPTGLLSDWSPCSSSTACSSSCCSGEFSEGGVLKCHPSGSSQTCLGSLKSDWARCDASTECSSSCCSTAYSTLSKCHPSGSTSACAGSRLGNWSTCTVSSQCTSACCSGEFSEGGVLKCHPAGSSQRCA
jgi:hypothetical protein